MLQAGSGVDAMVLENGDMGDAGIEAQRVVARLVRPQHIGQVLIFHQGSRLRVVGSVDDHIMHAEPLNVSAGAVYGANGFDIARQGRELVGHHPYSPGATAPGGYTKNLGRSFLFIARTERTGIYPRRDGFWRSMRSQFFRTLGAFRGDNHPFLGEIILPKLGHMIPLR